MSRDASEFASYLLDEVQTNDSDDHHTWTELAAFCELQADRVKAELEALEAP
jgi:hypothetical protein